MAAPMAAPAKNHARLPVLSSFMNWFTFLSFILSGGSDLRYGEQMDETPQVTPESEEFDGESIDPSHELDLETIFEARGIEAEMEAIGIRSVLEAAGIPAVLEGSSSLPMLPFAV